MSGSAAQSHARGCDSGEPTAEEVALTLDCSPQEVREIQRMAQHPVSLEKPVGEEDDSALGDFIEDQTAESPFDLAARTMRDEHVCRALSRTPAGIATPRHGRSTAIGGLAVGW